MCWLCCRPEGGKSAIYELAGLLRTGPVVVVSPLIALQDDQLAHLRASGLSAIVLNSQLSASAHAAALLASCDVYAATHASAKQAHDALASAGEQVQLYHAGLSGRERHDAMTAFLDGNG